MQSKTARKTLIGLLNKKQKELYRYRPDLWWTERWGEPISTLDWTKWNPEKYEKHKWDGTPNPFMKAILSLANRKNVGIESATSTGKTFYLPRVIYWFLDVYDDGLVITTAPTGQHLREVLWGEMANCFHRFKKLNPKAEMYNLRLLPDGQLDNNVSFDDELANKKSEHKCLGIVTSTSAGEKSAVKFQGWHAKNMLFVLEETAGLNHAIITAIKSTITGENNMAIGVGNPDSQTDALHQFCTLPDTEHIIISALDHPNIVLQESVIPGAITQKSIDSRGLEYGKENPFFQSRVRGIAPKQDMFALIKWDWVYDSWVGSDNFHGTEVNNSNYNAIGVDCAQSENGDKACVLYGEKNIVKRIDEFSCPNSNALAHNLIYSDDILLQKGLLDYNIPTMYETNVSPDRIGVDSVGVGAGTINTFSDLGYDQVESLFGGQRVEAIPLDNEEKLMYEFSSFRSQMLYTLAVELQRKEIILQIPEQQLNDLCKAAVEPKFKMSEKKINIESKTEIVKRLGKSPNDLDALMYWNWMRKNRGNSLGGIMFK